MKEQYLPLNGPNTSQFRDAGPDQQANREESLAIYGAVLGACSTAPGRAILLRLWEDQHPVSRKTLVEYVGGARLRASGKPLLPGGEPALTSLIASMSSVGLIEEHREGTREAQDVVYSLAPIVEDVAKTIAEIPGLQTWERTPLASKDITSPVKEAPHP